MIWCYFFPAQIILNWIQFYRWDPITVYYSGTLSLLTTCHNALSLSLNFDWWVKLIATKLFITYLIYRRGSFSSYEMYNIHSIVLTPKISLIWCYFFLKKYFYLIWYQYYCNIIKPNCLRNHDFKNSCNQITLPYHDLISN